MYNKSHTRASPYIIGMLSGNLFMKLQNSGFKLSQFTATVSFFFSIVVLGLCMASGNLLGLNNQAGYDPLISGIYAAVNRLVWAFGTAVFVLSLSFGDIRKWTYFWEIATLKTSINSFIYFGTSEYFGTWYQAYFWDSFSCQDPLVLGMHTSRRKLSKQNAASLLAVEQLGNHGD